jgi:hypothetical protein
MNPLDWRGSANTVPPAEAARLAMSSTCSRLFAPKENKTSVPVAVFESALPVNPAKTFSVKSIKTTFFSPIVKLADCSLFPGPGLGVKPISLKNLTDRARSSTGRFNQMSCPMSTFSSWMHTSRFVVRQFDKPRRHLFRILREAGQSWGSWKRED